MGNNKNNNLNHEYMHRINKVLDYIDSNMGDDLTLDVLSKSTSVSVQVNFGEIRVF